MDEGLFFKLNSKEKAHQLRCAFLSIRRERGFVDLKLAASYNFVGGKGAFL